MYILDELWRGKITPSERRIREGSRYAEVLHDNTQRDRAFCATLTAEQRKAYEEIYNGQMELLGIAEEESFVLGYRIGVRLLLDAIGDHKAQLTMMNGSSVTG